MKCSECKYKAVDFLTTYDGRCLTAFNYCNRDVCIGRLVDPDVERECDDFVAKSDMEVVEDASRPSR